jgi:hypothetical protein
MRADVPELTAQLGCWLRQVSHHGSQGCARTVAANDVTVAAWAKMRVIYGTQPAARSPPGWIVSCSGRRAVCFGRAAAMHVERVPQ